MESAVDARNNQPDRNDITFVGLLILTWTLLAWFAQQQHGRLPLALAGLVGLCVLFAYSVATTGNCLNRIGWTWPHRRWYWLAGAATGAGGACVLGLFLWLGHRPLPIRDTQQATVVLAVGVAPILEEVIFRGLILSAALYLCGRLRLSRSASAWLSVVAAALLFGLAHSGRTGTPLAETVLMGVAYGWLRIQSGSTAVSAGAHSSFNLVLTFLAH